MQTEAMHLHENREKFAAPESRRARSIHDQTGMRPAEHLAVMQRARTCGIEQGTTRSPLTAHHDDGNAAFSARTSEDHCSLSPTRRPLARPAPMATYEGRTEGRRHRVAKCPPFRRHFTPSERPPPAQAHTHARARVLRFHFR